MCMLTTGLIQIALFRPYNTKQVYLLVAFDLDVPKPFILSLFLKQIMSGGGPTPIYIYIYIYIYIWLSWIILLYFNEKGYCNNKKHLFNVHVCNSYSTKQQINVFLKDISCQSTDRNINNAYDK